MKINLHPMSRSDSLTLHVAGDVLTINGVPFDFGPLPEGATLPQTAVGCEWLVSDVTRIDGELCLTLILPLGHIPFPPPPEARVVTHAEPLHVTTDGPVTLPSWTAAVTEEGAA